jgi:hypothetical protein
MIQWPFSLGSNTLAYYGEALNHGTEKFYRIGPCFTATVSVALNEFLEKVFSPSLVETIFNLSCVYIGDLSVPKRQRLRLIGHRQYCGLHYKTLLTIVSDDCKLRLYYKCFISPWLSLN